MPWRKENEVETTDGMDRTVLSGDSFPRFRKRKVRRDDQRPSVSVTDSEQRRCVPRMVKHLHTIEVELDEQFRWRPSKEAKDLAARARALRAPQRS
jgi:hypothetical protein